MPLSRRHFLAAAGLAAAGLAALAPRAAWTAPATPFTLGIASGYPHPHGFTLWTRLAPDPLAGGGLSGLDVAVRWEIADDDAFRRIVARGEAIATAGWAHSIHIDVEGLAPDRWYWYRFTALGERSPVGRTRTAPAAGQSDVRLALAFASCQQYEQGYYAAYRHMAREPLDLVVHLGDYIYESSWGRNHVRSHGTPEPVTLEDYRNRHALYKTDADLQAAHAAAPWLVTWDDHEVQNDYADDRSQMLDEPAAFLARRAAAYQAYYEHMPLPAWARPRGAAMRLHTRVAFGDLALFHVLDARQYRSHQVCARPGRGGSNTPPAAECPERLDEALSMLGREQEGWLYEGLATSRARWNVVAQQTLMAQADRSTGAGQAFWTDGWDGYPRNRERLLTRFTDTRVANPVVISGDVHMAGVADLRVDFDRVDTPVVATEFCGTSITSHGPNRKAADSLLGRNPHLKHADGTQRGYTRLDLTRERCLATYRVIDNVRDRASGIRDAVRYVVEDGRPGAIKA